MADELARPDCPPGPVGESWEVYDLGDVDGVPVCSVVEGGPHDGRPLREVLGAPVPLLLKVLDARDDLSVQVHPDGRDGSAVKEEAWVALADGGAVAVEPEGSVCAGAPAAPAWLEHLDRSTLRAGCAAGSRPPTLVHVPPGTVHAILAGSLLFEVQNPVDVTWRLDDHGRTDADGRLRPLHEVEALGVLGRPTAAPVAPSADGRRLDAAHFRIELLPPGTTGRTDAAALHFTAPGTIAWGDGESFAVPAARTVWLSAPVLGCSCSGWIVAAAPR